jgi:uncharacterized protein involved in response to NO
MAIPGYHPNTGPVLFSAGFRPFFLLASLWAAAAVPIWLAAYADGVTVPSVLAPAVWHAHEMIFGFGAAVVAGFLLTAIPNWTGRLPLQGWPLAALAALWLAGRIAVLFSAATGAAFAAAVDLAFPLASLLIVAREIMAGRNWRNLPVLVALGLLLAGNLLVHLEANEVAETAELGNRVGIATLLALISLMGGRIIPSFTRNWLVKHRPQTRSPAPPDALDHLALGATVVALVIWVLAPDGRPAAVLAIAAGLLLGLRLARWRGVRSVSEPLVLILHIGYGWLAAGFILLGLAGLGFLLPPTVALHALTVGVVGTMTLAVMTRASLGHSGRPLVAGSGTTMIYGLVGLAALLRLCAAFAGPHTMAVLWLAGAAWSGAFALFVLLYVGLLALPRVRDGAVRTA